MRDFLNNLHPLRAISPVSVADNTAEVGQIIDRQGYDGLTFVIVMVAWVFFRAPTLPAAMHYLGAMLGASTVQSGAVLIGGIVHQPYYVVCCALAAWVVTSRSSRHRRSQA